MKDIARLTRLRNLDFDRLRLIEEYDKLTTYDELESEVNSDYLCLKTYNNEETCQCFNFVSKFDWFLKSKKWKLYLLLVFLMSPLLMFVINSFLNTGYASDLLERLNEISFDANSNVSGFIRIFRGYVLWNDMDFMSKIFGVSTNYVLGNLVTYYNSYWLFSEELYLNTFQSKLVYAGILGVFLYIYWLYSVFRKSDVCGKVLMFVLLVLMLMESVNLSLILMYVLLALSGNSNNSLNRNKFYAK